MELPIYRVSESAELTYFPGTIEQLGKVTGKHRAIARQANRYLSVYLLQQEHNGRNWK
jgi:hypothetical protein